jgi:hypothetical protein
MESIIWIGIELTTWYGWSGTITQFMQSRKIFTVDE